MKLQVFSLVFLSILFEALPFILIGSIVSGMIETFVSEERLRSLIPKNKFLALVTGGMLGIIFPVCECGVIPVVRRLVKKGVPLHIAITYMLAAPIVNPVVIASTAIAFRGNLVVILGRVGLGLIVALCVGTIVSSLGEGKGLLKKSNPVQAESSSYAVLEAKRGITLGRRAEEVLNHATYDFIDMGKYLILGSFVAALTQTFISRPYLLRIGSSPLASILVMMILAVALSLCSEADAFVANSFTQFSTASKLAFLVLGPMFDLKLLFMFLGTFRKRLTVRLVWLTISLVFILTYIFGGLYA